MLEPVIARYRERGIDLYFRADAAFAKPEIYELLEARGHPLRHPLTGQPGAATTDQPFADTASRPATEEADRLLRQLPLQPRAGPKPAGWWPRSSGTRASYIPASASS